MLPLLLLVHPDVDDPIEVGGRFKAWGNEGAHPCLTEVRQEVAQLKYHVLASPWRERPSLQAPDVVVGHQDDRKRYELCFLDKLGQKMATHVGLLMKNDSHQSDALEEGDNCSAGGFVL